MALPTNADVVVVQGYWWDEITQQGVANASVSFKPVPLGSAVSATKTPNLRDLGASGYVKTRARVAAVDPDTGYFATLMVASNDPDLDAYGGREVVFASGSVSEPPFVVEVPYNASTTTVNATMANATGLQQGSTVRVVWLADAALLTTPTPAPSVNYLTSTQTLAAVTNAVEAHEESEDAHPEMQAALLAGIPEQARDALGTALVAGANITITPDDGADTITIAASVPAGYTDEQAQDTFAALIAAGTHSGISFFYNDASNTLSATVTAQSWSQITGKPTFAAVATSGSASDITTGTLPDGVIPSGIARDSEVTSAVSAASTDDRARANHTGTQASTTISDFTEAVQDAVASLLGAGSNITLNYNDAANTLTVTGVGDGTGLDAEAVRDAIGVALVGVGNIAVTVNDGLDTITISTTATVNSSDATLLARANHTGAQAISTVTGLQTALDAKAAAAGAVVNPLTGMFHASGFGIVGDGTTNNTTAINTALTAVGATKGTLYFSPGVYMTDGGHTLPSYTHVRGSEPSGRYWIATSGTPATACALQLRTGTSATAMFTTASGWTASSLRDITLLGANIGTGIGCLDFASTSTEQSFIAENVAIVGFTGDGVRGSMLVQRWSNFLITACHGWGMTVDGSHQWTDSWFTDGIVSGNRTGGLNIDSSGNTGLVNFTGVRFERSGWDPANQNTPIGVGAPGIRILGNAKDVKFISCDTDGNSGHGLDIDRQSSGRALFLVSLLGCNFRRDGYGDMGTLPEYAAIRVRGVSGASVDMVSFSGCSTSEGKARDDGTAPAAVHPKYGLWAENTAFLSWTGGAISTSHNTPLYGGSLGWSSNYRPLLSIPKSNTHTLPVWGTATRPTVPTKASVGFNSDTNQLDWYTGSTWSSTSSGGSTVDSPDDIGAQPVDSDLTAIAALAPSNDDIIQRKAGAWTNRTVAQVKTDLGLATVATSGSAADLTGTLDDARIPSGIARDSEVTSAVSGLVATSDARLTNSRLPRGQIGPSRHGLVAWTSPITECTATGVPTAGIVYLLQIELHDATTVTGVGLSITSGGSGMSNAYAGLIQCSTGDRVAVSADASSSWNSVGDKLTAFTAPYSAAAGTYWIALLVGAGTAPTIFRLGSTTAPNFNLAQSDRRWAQYGTASQTSIPTTGVTPGATVPQFYWAGLY